MGFGDVLSSEYNPEPQVCHLRIIRKPSEHVANYSSFYIAC